MELRLHVIPGSHPCVAVEAAMALKGLHYERVDLLPGASQFIQRARFGRRTVPGLEVDGYRVSGSRLIMRTLDGLRAEPRLYPADPQQLAAVEAADEWADAQLQEATRWIVVLAVATRPDSAASFLADANLPKMPEAVQTQSTRAVFSLELRVLGGGAASTERWLRELPGILDRADELIAEGVIGRETPNAVDLQVAASIRLLLNVADLRDAIEPRPCGQLARRLIPNYPGEVPAGALPAEWLPALATA
jgi:glutathione S-transferase